MASFFRRVIAEKLSVTLQQSGHVFIPAITAVPVNKKQRTTDFRLNVSSLQDGEILPCRGNVQLQTEELAKKLELDSVVEGITTSKETIHFRVNRPLLIQKVLECFGNKQDDLYGLDSELLKSLKRGTTLVEYSSPNIAKKFHVGHLRSTMIGQFIANLKQTLGHKVIRMNYLGDWGMQFGFLGAGYSRFGCQEALKRNPLQHLFEVYVRVHLESEHNEEIGLAAREFYSRLEQREDSALSLWKQFRDITVKEYQLVYQRLGVHFDIYSGESMYLDGAQTAVDQLRTRGLFKTTEKGTGVVDLSVAGDMSDLCPLLRSDGTTLYITRDIAAAVDRHEKFCFDEMIYVTDKSQENHFNKLFQILQASGHSWAARCRHVSFGLVKGMKTRRGDVVFLEDVLDEARVRMLQNTSRSQTTKEVDDPEQTAETVGISALIVQDFRHPLSSDYKFDWDRVLQSQGDTGVFLQYSHARLCSLIRQNEEIQTFSFDPSLLLEDQSVALVQHLLRYDEVLLRSTHDLQPKHLVNFLIRLSHLVASAHRGLPVKGSQQDVAQARLRLFVAARSVLSNGMKILGIKPVEKM